MKQVGGGGRNRRRRGLGREVGRRVKHRAVVYWGGMAVVYCCWNGGCVLLLGGGRSKALATPALPGSPPAKRPQHPLSLAHRDTPTTPQPHPQTCASPARCAPHAPRRPCGSARAASSPDGAALPSPLPSLARASSPAQKRKS
eukprot:266531-Chlamydomonas_euryale.AAC.2